jgi:hypothetical protein
MSPIVSVEHVAKRFGRNRVLAIVEQGGDDAYRQTLVSLDLDSGKTTVLFPRPH